MNYIRDLTEEDESLLPLPSNWIRTIQIKTQKNSLNPIKLYKHLPTQLMTEEHPFIAQALQRAKNIPLVPGWNIKEVQLNDGTSDLFFFNSDLGVSMWDPPSLRICLAECLLENNYDPFELNIVPLDNQFKEYEARVFPTGNIIDYKPSPPDDNINSDKLAEEFEQPADFVGKNNLFDDQKESIGNEYNFDVTDVNDEEMKSEINFGQQIAAKSDDNSDYYSNQVFASREMYDRDDDDTIQQWSKIAINYNENIQYGASELAKVSHRIGKSSRPPMSEAGINILKQDVIEANDRVNQLLTQLRFQLASIAGKDPSVIYHNRDTELLTSEKDIITLASDIVTTLRQNPQYIIQAMVITNKPGSTGMIEVAFTALHRLLHPFSTDNSLTTAILLQAINYQLDELMIVEKLFDEVDSKIIISRALFISDSEIAVNWDPLQSPMPMVPQVPSETVLACLLRVYAIRRDVTAYFRAIWKPVLPSVVALCTEETLHGSNLFTNTWSIANRLMECLLNERSMVVFPSIATAMCRVFHEIGGYETLHYYLLNFLIIPNLLKILLGDNESIENEDSYDTAFISKLSDKYFDNHLWFSSNNTPYGSAFETQTFLQLGQQLSSDSRAFNHFETQNPSILDAKHSNVLSIFIFLVWKLYSTAVFITDPVLRSLTIQQLMYNAHFLSSDPDGQPPLQSSRHSLSNYTGVGVHRVDIHVVSDMKTRSSIERIRRKIQRGCEIMLRMPIDEKSHNMILGVSPTHPTTIHSYLQKFPNPKPIINHNNHPIPAHLMTMDHEEMTRLYDKRLSTLHFKPNEMLDVTIVSRIEMDHLFTDVGVALEFYGHDNNSALYQAISEYLSMFSDEDYEDDRREELMQLTFLYSDSKNNLKKSEGLSPQKVEQRVEVEKKEEFGEEVYYYDINSSSHEQEQALDKTKKEEEEGMVVEEEPMDHLMNRYRQLCRGLKLANRYEDTLIRMIKKIKNNQIPTLFDLIEDESWFHSPEFDAEFKTNRVKIAQKPTQLSLRKMKKSYYGLEKPPKQNIIPLFAKHWNEVNSSDHSPDALLSTGEFKDRETIAKEMMYSFRFGSSSGAAAVGTSMARPKLRTPLIAPGQLPVTTVQKRSNKSNWGMNSVGYDPSVSSRGSSQNRSKFTKVELSAKSNLLTSTESLKNPSKYDPETIIDRDAKFMNAMRNYNVIPTEAFLAKQERIRQKMMDDTRRTSLQQPNPIHSQSSSKANGTRSHSHKTVQSSQAARSHTIEAKPFPEFLRDRIRGGDQDDIATLRYGTEEYEGSSNMQRYGDDQSTERLHRRPDGNDESDCDQLEEFELDGNNPLDDIEDIIKDYQTLFTHPSSGLKEVIPVSNKKQAHKSILPRKVPTPIIGTNYFVPTESLLNRLEVGNRIQFQQMTANETEQKITARLRRSSKPTNDQNKPKRLNQTLPSLTGMRNKPFKPIRKRQENNREKKEIVQNHPIWVESNRMAVLEQVDNAVIEGRDEDKVEPIIMEEKRMTTDGVSKSEPPASPTSSVGSKTLRRKPFHSSKVKVMDPDEPLPPQQTSPGSRGSSPYGDIEAEDEDMEALEKEIDQYFLDNNQSFETRDRRESDDYYVGDDSSRKSISDSSHYFHQQHQHPPHYDSKLPSKYDQNESPRQSNGSFIPIMKRKYHIRDNQEIKNMFRNGFLALKHGRKGKPKMKLIKLNEETQSIEWTSSKSQQPSTSSSSSNLMNIFLNRNSKEDKLGSISLKTIMEIRKGIQTDVLSKAGLLDPSTCLSIITIERTLDLTLPTSIERDTAVRGLQLILSNFPNVIYL